MGKIVEGVWNFIVENQVVCSCINEKVKSNTDYRELACEVSEDRKKLYHCHSRLIWNLRQMISMI